MGGQEKTADFKTLGILCMRALSACMPECQKRPPDPIIDDCELSCGYQELNSGPLEE